MYQLLAEPLVALSVLLLLAVIAHYMWLQTAVSRLRVAKSIEAPAVTGDPEFERAFRAQANSLEMLAVFLPCYMILILLTGLLGNEVFLWITVALGFLYLVGRVLYVRTYMMDATKRGVGAVMSFMVNALMVLALCVQFLMFLF